MNQKRLVNLALFVVAVVIICLMVGVYVSDIDAQPPPPTATGVPLVIPASATPIYVDFPTGLATAIPLQPIFIGTLTPTPTMYFCVTKAPSGPGPTQIIPPIFEICGDYLTRTVPAPQQQDYVHPTDVPDMMSTATPAAFYQVAPMSDTIIDTIKEMIGATKTRKLDE